MAKRKRKTPSKRIGAALTRYLRKLNPAMRGATHVHMRKLKGGGVSFVPMRRNASERRYDILLKVPGERNWRGMATIPAGSGREALKIFRRDIHPARGEKLKAKLRNPARRRVARRRRR
jgi:hypothetical protein